MVYNVTGACSGFEYEDLPAISVTVKNLRTSESKAFAASAAAVYTADLDNVADYPSGKLSGDEIEITATHRGITRSWKRRVAGTSLPQDVYFTHGTWEGVLRKAKLRVRDVITGKTGTTVTLRDATTRDVLEVKKNGTLLAASAWSFTAPATLTVTVALVLADVLEVTRAINRGKEDAKEAVVEEGDSDVRNAMARHYKALMNKRVPMLQSISEALAAARLRDELFSSGDRVDSEAKQLREGANRRLNELRKGEFSITDQDDAYVDPTAQATTVPKSSTSPTRAFELWDETRRDLF